ncbi:ankyrin repeat-containing domain protein [Mycena sanguinolenta]|nr:ankyrin repeat-containing domain protein [Mycena sanguinolenta]
MYNGGLSVSQEMKNIIARPGYISSKNGGQRLRKLYRAASLNMDPTALSPFGLSVFTGHLDSVKGAVERGTSPDLAGTETPFKTVYASLAILGAQRMTQGPPGSLQHVEALQYLFSKGLSPNVEDLVGFTALHHATTCPVPKEELTRCLLECGADINHQNRYGEISLVGAMQLNLIPTIDILMEYGADIDIRVADADGWTARQFFLTKVWPSHKKTCQPFSASTVTLTPCYNSFATTVPVADLAREDMGYPTQSLSWSKIQTRGVHVPKNIACESKTLVIKVQVPYSEDPQTAGTGNLFVYNKKRDFACSIRRSDAPADYDRLSLAVKSKGVGGKKAYFAAELESRDKLVVKVSEILAEQPW